MSKTFHLTSRLPETFARHFIDWRSALDGGDAAGPAAVPVMAPAVVPVRAAAAARD